MDDASNDRTIGRTNATAASPSSSALPPTLPAPPPPANESNINSNNNNAIAIASPPTSGQTTSLIPLSWPTSAHRYRLINRVGQGAFASVWRARIVSDNADTEDTEGRQCAIKIMDLEHVNSNIGGECRIKEREMMGRIFVYDMMRCLFVFKLCCLSLIGLIRAFQ